MKPDDLDLGIIHHFRVFSPHSVSGRVVKTQCLSDLKKGCLPPTCAGADSVKKAPQPGIK